MALDNTRSSSAKPRSKRVLIGAMACFSCIFVLALLIALRPEPVGAIPLSQDPPTPTSSPTPPPLLDTSNATNLVCGGVYSGATQTLTNNVSLYGCKPWWDESGKEAVYRLQLNASQDGHGDSA